MPTLTEMTALFDVLPELPPPLPRRRNPLVQSKAAATHPPAPTSTASQLSSSFIQRLFPWAFPTAPVDSVRSTNPFLSLKTGKKMVVIAAVDAGMISFFRFGQGVFTDWPMA